MHNFEKQYLFSCQSALDVVFVCFVVLNPNPPDSLVGGPLAPSRLRRAQCHVCQVSISLCVRVRARVLAALHSQTQSLPRSRVKRSSWLRPALLGKVSGGKLTVECFPSLAVNIFEDFTDRLRVLPATNFDDFHRLSNQVFI